MKIYIFIFLFYHLSAVKCLRTEVLGLIQWFEIDPLNRLRIIFDDENLKMRWTGIGVEFKRVKSRSERKADFLKKLNCCGRNSAVSTKSYLFDIISKIHYKRFLLCKNSANPYCQIWRSPFPLILGEKYKMRFWVFDRTNQISQMIYVKFRLIKTSDSIFMLQSKYNKCYKFSKQSLSEYYSFPPQADTTN